MASYFDLPKFNWLPRPSMWREAQDRAQRQADIKLNEDLTSAIVSKLSNVNNVAISSKANLAAKAALKRIQAATAAKQAKQQAEQEKLARNSPMPSLTPKDITLSDGTIIKGNPEMTLDGGSKVNPKTGVITLSDGTQISILTGQKIDVTT